eukprot:scaffold304434_cov28-Tisochrysis_lutea.AAC.6
MLARDESCRLKEAVDGASLLPPAKFRAVAVDRESQMVSCSEVGPVLVMLRHHRTMARVHGVRERLAAECDTSRPPTSLPLKGKHGQQRSLACARRPHHREHMAGPNRARDILQYHIAAACVIAAIVESERRGSGSLVACLVMGSGSSSERTWRVTDSDSGSADSNEMRAERLLAG